MFHFTPIDALLLLMVFIWGSNFSVIKVALRELSPHGFNAIRLVLASALFLIPLSRLRPAAPSRREWLHIGLLGLIGHLLYQVCFMTGVARTSVANASLIIASSPVVVTLLAAAVSRDERVTRFHWLGAVLSALGIYIAVGHGAALSRASLVGDLLMLASVACWAVYTVGARPLLRRHSPLVVTAYSMAIGTVFYVPLGLPDLARLDWSVVSLGTWVGLVYSAAFALCLAYLIWYTAVQRIGNPRTAVYSNMIPLAAMTVAALWLRESIGTAEVVGAATVIGGVAVTKIGPPVTITIPAEE